jgi:hypothetical protein
MKTFLSRLLVPFSFLTFSVVLTGCVVAIGTGNGNDPQPPVVVTNSADAANLEEINAAGRLHLDEERARTLTRIAERPALTVAVQVHLINVTYRTLKLDEYKVQVLSVMIGRGDFCDATRHAIVSQLGKLQNDANRQTLLSQIDARLKAPPAAAPTH